MLTEKERLKRKIPSVDMIIFQIQQKAQVEFKFITLIYIVVQIYFLCFWVFRSLSRICEAVLLLCITCVNNHTCFQNGVSATGGFAAISVSALCGSVKQHPLILI